MSLCVGVHSQLSRRLKTTKVVHSRDLGFDCEGVVRAGTEEEVLAQVAAHAKAVHNLETVSEQVVDQVCKVMRED
jgi:predicted small metal-binding protein